MDLVMGATLSAIRFGSFLIVAMHSLSDAVSMVALTMDSACLLYKSKLGSFLKERVQLLNFIFFLAGARTKTKDNVVATGDFVVFCLLFQLFDLSNCLAFTVPIGCKKEW